MFKAIKYRKAMRLFDKAFGKNYNKRLVKLREESTELVDAITTYLTKLEQGTATGHDIAHVEEEISDVIGVAAHTGHVSHNWNLFTYLWASYTKVKTRIGNPAYEDNPKWRDAIKRAKNG